MEGKQASQLHHVMTRVRFGQETNIPKNVCPCNNDYKDLCNDVYLCVLNQSIA